MSVGLIPRNRLKSIPKRWRLAHSYCYFLHDECVRALVEYEAAGAHLVTINFESQVSEEEFNRLAKEDPTLALVRTGYPTEARRVVINTIIMSMVADCLHHIFEALNCFEKRKIVVGFNLLRKPLKQNLLYLAWVLGNENGFYTDLFTLADNAEVQKSLFDRLRRQDQYQGARYEMFVAASRAGFLIAFEDESDSTTSHCEFTATSRQTGRPFSVEAKSRHRRSPASDDEPTPKAGMYRLLQSALAKRANHERIIFADVNLPPDDKPLFQVSWHQEVAGSLNELEQKQKTDDPWPQAFVFFTNRITSPWPGKEAGRNPTVLLTAINHPLFKSEELRGEAERQYPEIGVLFRAANELRRAPSHFFAQ